MYLIQRLLYFLYNIPKRGFWEGMHSLVHTIVPRPHSQTEKDTKEPSVLFFTHIQQSLPDLEMSWLSAKLSEIIPNSSQYLM